MGPSKRLSQFFLATVTPWRNLKEFCVFDCHINSFHRHPKTICVEKLHMFVVLFWIPDESFSMLPNGIIAILFVYSSPAHDKKESTSSSQKERKSSHSSSSPEKDRNSKDSKTSRSKRNASRSSSRSSSSSGLYSSYPFSLSLIKLLAW